MARSDISTARSQYKLPVHCHDGPAPLGSARWLAEIDAGTGPGVY
ncbi:MAG TPA: hypothetical protein VGB85_33390 [Nannocystis sp.]